MRSVLRSAALAAAVLVLAGCKATLTNRVEAQSDGSATVHVIMTADDQLYSLAQSQGGSDLFSGKDSQTAGGWTVQRKVNANGDHVVDASTHVSTLQDVPKAFEEYYSQAASSASSQANTLSGISPKQWHFKVDRTAGLFTDTIHVHADVPKLMSDQPQSNSSDPWAAAGASMGREMLTSMLTVNTEIKLPGSIKSTNGEQMSDGALQFNHPLTSTSSIDIVDEVPDVPHIILTVVLGIVVVAGLVIGALRKRSPAPVGASIAAR
ncbi:MAG TPA: hypothetical protein VMA36_20430 [Candidatus Limnocylindria bacterium]|nr:hypothetical protein [Candidatus Limnocylindria bacterium]